MKNYNEFTIEEYPEYLEKHYKKNMIVNIVDVSIMKFAFSLVSVAVIIPAFCKRIGAGDSVLAYLQSIMMLGNILPQLFLSYHAEKLMRKKPFILKLGLIQRVPWLFVALLIPILLPKHPTAMLVSFLSLYLIGAVAGGISGPAWSEIIAKSIPQKVRGSFMGSIEVFGQLLAILGGFIVKSIMENDEFSYPKNYAILFIFTFILTMVSYFVFRLNKEPLIELKPSVNSKKDYFKSLPKILKTDKNFSYLLISRAFALSYVMGVAYFLVYSMQKFNATESITGNIIIISTITTVIASFFLGKIADSYGHKKVLILGRISNILAGILAIYASNINSMYLVFSLSAIGISSNMISMNPIIFEMAPDGKRPTYVGLSGTLTAPALLIFPFIGLKLMNWTNYGYLAPIFASVVVGIISLLILLFLVKDPRTIKN